MGDKVFTWKNLAAALLFMFLYIGLAVVVTLNFRPLYYYDMEHLHIPETSGYSEEMIRENYDILIDYNSMFYQGELQFNGLAMSEGGRIHFQEVKDIFTGFQKMFLADLVICAILFLYFMKRKSWGFLKLSGIITIVIPLVIGGLIAMNWEWCFVTFHHIAFDNDYWIFDYTTDPVINILPDTFFMHCAIMILAIVLFCAVVSFVAGSVLQQKRNNKTIG